jgi:hypothetical protein
MANHQWHGTTLASSHGYTGLPSSHTNNNDDDNSKTHGNLSTILTATKQWLGTTNSMFTPLGKKFVDIGNAFPSLWQHSTTGHKHRMAGGITHLHSTIKPLTAETPIGTTSLTFSLASPDIKQHQRQKPWSWHQRT